MLKELGQWLSGSVTSARKPPLDIPTLQGAAARARQNLAWAQNVYAQASDTLLVDYAIYQMLAAESEYRYFLRQARSAAKQS